MFVLLDWLPHLLVWCLEFGVLCFGLLLIEFGSLFYGFWLFVLVGYCSRKVFVVYVCCAIGYLLDGYLWYGLCWLGCYIGICLLLLFCLCLACFLNVGLFTLLDFIVLVISFGWLLYSLTMGLGCCLFCLLGELVFCDGLWVMLRSVVLFTVVFLFAWCVELFSCLLFCDNSFVCLDLYGCVCYYFVCFDLFAFYC